MAALALLRYRPFAERKVGLLRLRNPNPHADRGWWALTGVDRAAPPAFRREEVAPLGWGARPRHSLSVLRLPRSQRAPVRWQMMKVRALAGVLAAAFAV